VSRLKRAGCDMSAGSSEVFPYDLISNFSRKRTGSSGFLVHVCCFLSTFYVYSGLPTIGLHLSILFDKVIVMMYR